MGEASGVSELTEDEDEMVEAAVLLLTCLLFLLSALCVLSDDMLLERVLVVAVAAVMDGGDRIIMPLEDSPSSSSSPPWLPLLTNGLLYDVVAGRNGMLLLFSSSIFIMAAPSCLESPGGDMLNALGKLSGGSVKLIVLDIASLTPPSS